GGHGEGGLGDRELALNEAHEGVIPGRECPRRAGDRVGAARNRARGGRRAGAAGRAGHAAGRQRLGVLEAREGGRGGGGRGGEGGAGRIVGGPGEGGLGDRELALNEAPEGVVAGRECPRRAGDRVGAARNRARGGRRAGAASRAGHAAGRQRLGVLEAREGG